MSKILDILMWIIKFIISKGGLMTRIQVRRDTAANWESNNPVLAEGEWGYDTTNKNCKIGDGTRAWNNIHPQVRDGGTVEHGLYFSAAGSEWKVGGAGLSYSRTGDDYFNANILNVQGVTSGSTRDDYIVLGDNQMIMFEPSHITKLLLCSKQRPSVMTSFMSDYNNGGGELVAYLSDIKEYTSGNGINITEAEPEYTSVFGTLTSNTVADDYEFQVSDNPSYVANQSDMYKLYSDTDDVASIIVDNSPVEFAIIDSQKRFRAGDKIKVEMTIQLVQQVRQVGITIAGHLGLTGPTVRDTSDQTLTYELTLNEDLDKFTYTISTFVDKGYSGNRFYLKKFKISKANSKFDQREVSLAPATTSVLGGVKPDGTTITVTSDGTISVDEELANIPDEVQTLSTEVNTLKANVNNFKFWSGTQTAYDGIATKDPNTLYIITGE